MALARGRTGYVHHELFFWHSAGLSTGYFEPSPSQFLQPSQPFEHAETKRRLHGVIAASGLLEQLEPVKPRAATRAEIERFHTAEYVDKIIALSAKHGGVAGPSTPFSKGAYEIAALSAGGALAATDAVLSGAVRNAYALIRPPGHHAVAHQGMGFCIFNNGVLAVRHAMAAHGLKRVAVVDWDVHHGNGTQDAFYDSPDVLVASIHQDRCYPGNTGFTHEVGVGAGKGYNINIPLPAGSGPTPWLAAMERVILPALHAFRPEMILVCCGFDGSAYDPMARMMMTSKAYAKLTATVMKAADELCGGRLVVLHEGGYSAEYVPFCGAAVVQTLSGIDANIRDPFLSVIEAMLEPKLLAHQDEVIKRAEQNLKIALMPDSPRSHPQIRSSL